MINILSGLLVIACTICVPVILGLYLTSKLAKDLEGKLLIAWVMGIVFLFAQFQIIAIPMIIKSAAFSVLFHIYVAIVGIEVIFVLSRKLDTLLDAVKQVPGKAKKIGFIGLVVVLSILMQAFVLAYFEHVDNDDARFVPSAVAAIQKDVIFDENPITGEALYSRVSEVFKDMISPWIMMWAVLSKVTMIHPAIFMHSIVPLIFIPLAYAVYYIIATFLFEDDVEKKIIFLGFVSAINIFSGYSTYNQGSFLLLRIWQGKAMFAAIFAPLLLGLALYIWKKGEKVDARSAALVGITCVGSCLTSGFGIILSIMFVGIYSVLLGIARKSVRSMINLWIALIPSAVYAFLYAFGQKLFM